MFVNQSTLERYITREELTRLTDDENSGSVNIEKLNEAIVTAENEVESYLKGIYKFPLPQDLPEVLIHIIVDITIYNLYKRRMRLDMPESITNIYKEAKDKLQKIRRGELLLDLPIESEEGGMFIKVNKKPEDKIFKLDEL
jgi:phage gp36-like protein